MNEEIGKCIDCESFADGKCMYLCGAKVFNPEDEFVCIYFTRKLDFSYK